MTDTLSHVPGAIQTTTACRTFSYPMISGLHSFIATKATAHLRSFQRRRTWREWARVWAARGAITTTTAIRIFMFRACGKPQASEFQSKSNFMHRRRNRFANCIDAMRAGMRFIGMWGMAPLRMSGIGPELRWDGGRGQ